MIKEVNGYFIQSVRLQMGLSREDLARSLCLSVQHIRQLEEGGYQSFFSPSHKAHVAKRLGKKLGLNEEQLFCNGVECQRATSDRQSSPTVPHPRLPSDQISVPKPLPNYQVSLPLTES